MKRLQRAWSTGVIGYQQQQIMSKKIVDMCLDELRLLLEEELTNA